MCLLTICWRAVDEAPLIVAANREETYARGGTPPQIVDGKARFVAGLDPQAGGAWLGLNQHGVLIAVTNRRSLQTPDNARSRGLLVRDLLAHATAAEAVQAATKELQGRPYAGCNLLCADRRTATVLHAADWLRVLPLPIGVHVLTTGDLNNVADARIAYVLEILAGRSWPSAHQLVQALMRLCSQSNPHEAPPICLHGDERGTVSSAIVVLRASLAKSRYLHAQGPPDRVPYDDYSSLLAQIA